MSNLKETLLLGIDRLSKFYQKNKPKVLKTGALVGTFVIAGVTYYEAPFIKEELSKAVKEWKEANTGKEKATVAVEASLNVGKHALPVAAAVIGTDACIHGMYKEMDTRLGLALAGFAASQSELIDIKKAAKEVVGKKKYQQIEEKAGAAKYSEVASRKDPALYFDDMDSSNPDYFCDELTGMQWHGKYKDVLDGITDAYTILKTEGYPVTHAELIDKINYHKSGEPIRQREMSEYFVFDPLEAQFMHSVSDFIDIVQIGPNAYKLVYMCEIKQNPDKFGKSLSPTRCIDMVAGDGVWHG